ncbi:MAG: sulfatase-like hydrolase/transferase, partial [Pseudobutyrivibrio sp.]|nr:sulfatase-like hydrolase/transferase [Pseudobutyrivibrio sp.]
LYTMAVFFLVFLYNSPSGLVFYWTLNNLFSLVKTIFYKLKNPRKVLNIMLAIAGVVVMGLGVMSLGRIRASLVLIVLMVGAIMIMPLAISVLGRWISPDKLTISKESNPKAFIIAMLYMAVLVGGFIPSTVIASSPQEFICKYNNFHPAMYVTSALCYSIGFFVIWMGVFYWITEKDKKNRWEAGAIALCVVASVNYFVFNIKAGVLDKTLNYEYPYQTKISVMGINLLVIIVAVILTMLLYGRFKTVLIRGIGIVIATYVVLTTVNVVNINTQAQPALARQERNRQKPSFEFTTTGKNVVVIMLDRALGEYLPYIMDERPELKESYAGFTYYPNTVSFGNVTLLGSPALFGGYEYTPEAMNNRDSKLVVDKINEALRLMPVMFSDNGYRTTVCDPVYANGQWETDLSIYDDYPDINAYAAIGNFEGEYNPDFTKSNRRNFYCFGMMKIMPLLFQRTAYDDGKYLQRTNELIVKSHICDSELTAQGVSTDEYDNYNMLYHLSDVTSFNNNEENTFLFFRNDLAHSPSLLQLPDYEMKYDVDNTPYMDSIPDKLTLSDGSDSIGIYDFRAYQHYCVNMATISMIGEWLDYLKANDAYNNTRIIIVADHGTSTNNIESMYYQKDGINLTLERYWPLLMVKDFGCDSFAVSSEFMSNADVPTLAMEGIIDNPVNPFTQQPINNNRKYEGDLYILEGDPEKCIEGNHYSSNMWLSVHDDMRDINNWKEVQRDAIWPY